MTNKSIAAIVVLSILLFSGCYKKDQENFRKAGSIKYQPEFALPFLIADIDLNDTIPTVPLFTEVTMSDTASIELPKGPEKDSLETALEYLNFKILLENSFPFNGIVQLYFTDSNGVFVDSLLAPSERIVLPGTQSAPSNSDISVLITQERYRELTKKASDMFLFYRITANTTSGLQNSRLKVRIGIKGKLNVTLLN